MKSRDDEIIISDPNAPVAFDIEAVIDQAILNDNISPRGTTLYIPEVENAEPGE